MLANQNFIAFAHDHLGHGLSEGKRATIDSMDEVYNISSLLKSALVIF
jgi:alpha-beta hydrolase superfamily lysophospholipase